MKKIFYVFGFLLTKLKYLMYELIPIYNTESANNYDGCISGQTVIANLKNIYIGKESSINGDQIRENFHNCNNTLVSIMEQINFVKNITIDAVVCVSVRNTRG